MQSDNATEPSWDPDIARAVEAPGELERARAVRLDQKMQVGPCILVGIQL